MTEIGKIELLLFVAGEEGLTIKEITKILVTDMTSVNEAVEKLKVKYEKSKCIVVSTCKQYVCNLIFHSSLLIFHFRQAFFTFNF